MRTLNTACGCCIISSTIVYNTACDCKSCHHPNDEPTPTKVEGHWGRQRFGSKNWEILHSDPVELKNGFTYKFFPRFVPEVATSTASTLLIAELEKELQEEYGGSDLKEMSFHSGFEAGIRRAINYSKSHALVEENAIRKDEQKRLANLFNRRFIDPLIYSSVQLVNVRVVEDFIRNGGSK
jgi:hypothetical protein